MLTVRLYTFWDLGLKVGHSSRSLDDMVRMAKSDLTIADRTAPDGTTLMVPAHGVRMIRQNR